MYYGLQILVIFIMISVFVNILWLIFCITPFYTWLDRHFNFINYKYRERWDFLSHHDIKGDGKYHMILNNYLLVLPFPIVSFIIPQILFPESIYIYGLIVFFAITVPIVITYLRENVFSFKPELIEEGDYTKINHFHSNKYPANYTSAVSLPIVWCFIFFGLGNYLNNYNLKFLLLTIICLICEIMLLFPEKMDKILPLELTTSNGWWTFAIILMGISIASSFIIYPS